MKNAPLYTEIARGPDGGTASYLTCSDGVRIRVASWKGGDKGTILLLQGRTEYIEKYGPTAARFAEMGYAVAAIDFRGQGLSDRFGDAPQIGHVAKFSDYQRDIEAFLDYAAKLDLPKPYHCLCHSMGGAIGLRMILNGAPIDKAVFTGPMWRIYFSNIMKPISRILVDAAEVTGMGGRLAPSTKLMNYTRVAPFENNTLTNDREEWDWARHQMMTHPDLELGGPSMHWLREAFAESADLRAAKPLNTEMLCLYGENERINSKPAMRDMMAKWPNGRAVEISNAQHEILISEPAVKKMAWKEIENFLQAPASKANAA